jgi:hypothetical protein
MCSQCFGVPRDPETHGNDIKETGDCLGILSGSPWYNSLHIEEIMLRDFTKFIDAVQGRRQCIFDMHASGTDAAFGRKCKDTRVSGT